MDDKEVVSYLTTLLQRSNQKPNAHLADSILHMAKQNIEKDYDTSHVQLEKRQQCVVLGMHRSGTSALSGNEQDLLAAADDNVKGTKRCRRMHWRCIGDRMNYNCYFERSDVVKLDALLLGSLKASWCNGLGNFDLAKVQQDVKRDFLKRANAIARLLNDSGKPWQLKDPRMCLTFPLWREVTPEPVVVIAYRHPMEVANSLYKRNKIDIDFGLALWELYTLNSLKTSLGLPRICVSYQQLIADPVATTQFLYDQLTQYGVKGLTLPTKEQIFDFVDPSLNHSSGRTPSTDQLTENQKKLLEALHDRSALQWDEKAIPQMSEQTNKVLQKEQVLFNTNP